MTAEAVMRKNDCENDCKFRTASAVMAIAGIGTSTHDDSLDRMNTCSTNVDSKISSLPDRAVSAKLHVGFIQITQSILTQDRGSRCHSHNHCEFDTITAKTTVKYIDYEYPTVVLADLQVLR